MRKNTELQISLSRLQENFNLLRKVVGQRDVIFMVKANAYGHGLVEMAQAAYDQSKIRLFGVASLGEGMHLKQKLKAKKFKAIIFSDSNLDSFAAEVYQQEESLIPVITDLEDLELFLSHRYFKRRPLYLKFNTGMNRLGIHWEDCNKVVELIRAHGRGSIEHLMTHFSSSYLPIKPADRTYRQYEHFKNIKRQLRSSGIDIIETSVSNSGAIEQNFEQKESHVRPGLMLYGAKSFSQGTWSGQCLSQFKTHVLKIEQVKQGTPIGYGAHTCHRDGHLVYLPIGYGDGVLTYYSGQDISWHGKLGRILGRVNMDIITLFFETLPEGLERGDDFYFWDGSSEHISELSRQFKTTPYQIFTGITQRVPRRYQE